MAKEKHKAPVDIPPVIKKDINTIEPYWRNPRINDGGVSALAESIEQFGWTQPIVIDPKGVIVAGHTRYKAAKKLGLTEVPTVTLDLPEAKLKAYRIADNAVADQSTWNNELLIPELRGLDMDMQGFFGETLDLGPLLEDGPAVQAITEAETQAAADAVETPMAEGDVTRFVSVTCPHCGEDFRLAEKDVDARMGKEVE